MSEFNFIEIDPEKIKSDLAEGYTNIMGVEIQEGDPMNDYQDWLTYLFCNILEKINETAKENLLRYSQNSLDFLGEIVGVTRREATAASTTLKYIFSKSFDTTVIIPKGHKTVWNNIVFSTSDTTYLPIGSTEVETKSICSELGESGNGIAIGELKEIVDPIPYLKEVYNTTVTEGGAELEDNESLRERIHENPTAISTAGPRVAYEYHAKSSHQDIIDVHVSSVPKTGVVDIYPLLKGGKIPGEEIMDIVVNYFKNKEIKPLTDVIKCSAPNGISCNINFTYYVDETNKGLAESIKLKVGEAVQAYKIWQSEKLGRDINPDKLRWLVLNAGAKRVEVVEPIFKKLEGNQVCQISGETMNFGGIEDD